MFNSFRNSDLGYYLYTAFVLILGVGSLIFFYFMVTGFNIGVYEQNTLIGNVYVGGLTEDEAEDKVRDRVNAWYEDEGIVYELGYQGYYYEIDRNLFTFDITATFNNVSDGSRNQLMVELSPQALANIDFELHSEDFMGGLQGLFDFDAVMDGVIEDAEDLSRFSRHQLNHYTIDDAQLIEELNSIMIPIHDGVDMDSLLAKIQEDYSDLRIPVESHSVFSVFDMFSENLTSSELNTIGSGLLDLIIPTKLEIYERHYNPQIDDLDESPYVGRNVRINRHESLQYNFQFENPGFLNYEIEFYRVNANLLGIRLHGAQYIDTVEIETEDINLPYTPASDDATIIEEGQDGKVLFIYRDVYDLHDQHVNRTLIVFEYYEPLNPITE